jgi:hypothetical protein
MIFVVAPAAILSGFTVLAIARIGFGVRKMVLAIARIDFGAREAVLGVPRIDFGAREAVLRLPSMRHSDQAREKRVPIPPSSRAQSRGAGLLDKYRKLKMLREIIEEINQKVGASRKITTFVAL